MKTHILLFRMPQDHAKNCPYEGQKSLCKNERVGNVGNDVYAIKS